jgi:hypothetical protein
VYPGWNSSVAVLIAARFGSIALVGIANKGLGVTQVCDWVVGSVLDKVFASRLAYCIIV